MTRSEDHVPMTARGASERPSSATPQVDDAALWQALPVPALLLDAGGRVRDANPAAEAFFMRSCRAMRGRRVVELFPRAAGLEERIEQVLDGTTPLVLSDLEARIDGQAPAAVDMRLSVLDRAPDGQQPAVLMLVEPRSIAERIGQARQNRMAARTAIGMAEMLAHEIRNPLAGITGAAQLLAMNLGGEDLELTGLIVEESRRILGLIDQVEQFGDQRPPVLRAVNIHDVLERARTSARLGFAAHMRIRDAYDPSLPDVAGDPDQLLQVFLNLIRNASEASPGGGNLWLRTRYENRMSVAGPDGCLRPVPVHVEIVDDGPGIPEELRDSLFEPFISGRENGTGLGLALVSKIIAAHGGLIALHSEPGSTVFRISLPLASSMKTGGRDGPPGRSNGVVDGMKDSTEDAG